MQEDHSALRAEYKCKSYALYCALFLDVVFNGLVDSRDSVGAVGALVGIQVVVRLLTLFLTFLVMSSTFVFRHGLIGELLARFRVLLVVAPLVALFTFGFRAYRLVGVIGSEDMETLWTSNAYKAVYFLHNFACIVYYVLTIRTCQQLGDPKLYKPSTWLR